MTYAPAPLLEVRAFLKGQDVDLSNDEVGIVGGPGHIATGTSYHLGLDQLKMDKNPYSARTTRDKAGLADPDINDAANASDIDDDLDELRPLSIWLVTEARKSAPDTLDIREVIYSPDGILVLQWDRERGVTSPPRPHSDLSHRKHTHISWYRDSARRSKVGLFQRYFQSHGKKVIDVFYLQVKGEQAVYVSDGIHTRNMPGGTWETTCQPLIDAGVPFLGNYPTLEALFAAGGPLVSDGVVPVPAVSLPTTVKLEIPAGTVTWW